MSRRFDRRAGNASPDEDTFLQASRLFTDIGNGPRSHVVLIGPFETQLIELSSSESGSDSSSDASSICDSLEGRQRKGALSPDSLTHRARRRYASSSSAGSPTNNATDWVAYGEDEEGFEDLDLNQSSVNISDISSSLRLGTGNDEESGEDSEDECSPVSQFFGDKIGHHLPLTNGNTPATSAISTIASRAIPLIHPQQQLRRARSSRFLPPSSVPVYKLTPIIIDPHTLALQRAPSPEHLPPTKVAYDDDDDANPNTCNPNQRLKAEEDLLPRNEYICSACEGPSQRMIHLLPCGDIACPSCFSSSVAAVSVTHGMSRCPACLTAVTTFEPYLPANYVPVRPPLRPTLGKTAEPVVMRIDNVAWDIEPHIVERFLPPNSLPPGHLHPIHVCLDLRDGRTKDYMYVEVASPAAARRVLQLRQNVFMPGGRVTGGRMRAVTISQVEERELMNELRPRSKADLISLLELCEATLTTPRPQLRLDNLGRGRLHASTGANGKIHYIKYRHAPFHALMSILSKVGGRDSPAYWDIHHVATGAISALAACVDASPWDAHGDRSLLKRLIATFDATFVNTRLSFADRQ